MYTKWYGLSDAEQMEVEKKHPYILTLYHNLARLKMKMGRYADSLDMFQSCFDYRKEFLGEDHPDTLATMNNLAELLDVIGEHDKAKDLYMKSLDLSFTILERNHPFTARFMRHLDNLSKNELNYRNRLELFSDHMSLREAVLGSTHSDSYQCMKDLSALYEEMRSHALEESEEKSGEVDNFLSYDTETSDLMVPPLAALISSEGIIHENTEILSLPSHENNIIWLAFVEEALRMKDPDPLTMVDDIANLYMKLKKYDQALPLFKNCLSIREQMLGKKHPDTLKSIRNLANLYKCMGKYYDALPLYEKFSSVLKDLFKSEPEHPYCLEIENDISLLYNEIGKFDKTLNRNKEKLSTENKPSQNNGDSHSGISDLQISCFTKLRHGFKYTLSASDVKSKHTSYVNAVCSTNKYIVSASDDMRLLVWEVSDDRIVFQRELRGHTGPIVSLYVMRNGDKNNQILSASRDGTIKQWNLDRGVCVQSIKHDDSSVNECLAVICNEKYIFKGVRNQNLDNKKRRIHVIHVFDVNFGGFLYEHAGHTEDVRCFALTSDYLFSGSLDNSIIRWHLESITTHVCDESITRLLGHTDWVRSLCCTKDELRLISGSNDMTVRIWDIQTGETIQILSGMESRIRSVCMSDDGMQIICGAEDHTIRTWDLESGCPIRILRGHTDWVTSVCALAGTDKIVSCSSDLNVILWDVRSSPILFSVPHKNEKGKDCPILSLCQYDKPLLISCTKDVVNVWDPQQQYKNVSSHVFSDMMGAEVSCMCENKTNKSLIICCNYKSRGRSTVLESFVNDPVNIITSRDYIGITNCICACTNHLIIGLTHHNNILIRHYQNDNVNERICNLDYVPLTIDCVCVDSSANSIYIIIGSNSKDIFIWKCDCFSITNCFVLKDHIYRVQCLTHATNDIDQYVISGSDDYFVKLWRLPTERAHESPELVIEVKPEYSFEGHTRNVTSVLCTKDLIISGSSDTTIMIWSIDKRNLLRTLIGHTGDVTGLQISVVNQLVSTSMDGTMKVWDLSVGHNAPSEVELQELIRFRHKEYGSYDQVKHIINSMSTDIFASKDKPILEDIINNHPTLSLDNKSAALQEVNRLSECSKISRKSKAYNLSGFLKTFQLRINKVEKNLVRYSDEENEYEMIPCVHWMSRQLHYRDFLLDNILQTNPELLYTRAEDGKTLFSEIVQEFVDPVSIHHCLSILSTNLQHRSLEMMWCDHYTFAKDIRCFYNSPNLLVDVEDIVKALQALWRVDMRFDGILSLKREPEQQSKLGINRSEPYVCDRDTDKYIIVKGRNSLSELKLVSNKELTFINTKSAIPSEKKQLMYVPFPMRICRRGKYANEQHTSSLLLEICIEIAMKKDDASVFQSSVLTAILRYKIDKFGFFALNFQNSLCVTLAVHFGYYSIVHSKINIPIWWPIFLFIHCYEVVVVEFLPYLLNFEVQNITSFMHSYLSYDLRIVLSPESHNRIKYIFGISFLLLLFGVVGAVLWVSFNQPGSEYDTVLNLLLFMIIFSRAVNSFKYLPTFGLFVRMLLQVLGRMGNYVALLIIYFIGFATAFNILIPTVRRVYDQECGDTSDSDECTDMKAATERFQYPVISGVTTYMMMMNTMGWESTAFNISDAYSIYALIALACTFVFISNVALNITIALMNHIYEMISQNEHASCHLVQAQYVLGFERLLLFFRIIDLKDEAYFPRWICVLIPKSVDDNTVEKSADDNAVSASS